MTDVVDAYYDAIDAGDYERLESLLAPEFVQRRPDRTLVGRESFVSFMREGRPRTDTSHVIDARYEQATGDGVAVEGRVTEAEGSETLFAFVDVFGVEDGTLVSLDTYTQ